MGAIIFPRSVIVLFFILNTILIVAVRLCVRVYFSHFDKNIFSMKKNKFKKLLLIGAGKTGEKIAKDIRTSKNNQFSVVGFLDDDLKKHGRLVHGIKVFGNVSSLSKLSVKFDEILITAPTSTRDQMRRIVKVCTESGKRYRTMPGLDELIDGEISLERARDISYSDLLGRKEVTLDLNSIDSLLKGKRILITGAGGSIGSELVKQCLVLRHRNYLLRLK